MRAWSSEAVRALPHADPNDEFLIPDAYLFFHSAFSEWLKAEEGTDIAQKLSALYQAVTQDLQLVVIDLQAEDDAQVIFETLNALGSNSQLASLVFPAAAK